MPRLSHSEIASHALGAGLDRSAAVVACAISGWAGSPAAGESNGDPHAIGDVALVSGKWGPSIGLWQIRSLNAERGTGSTRDELANFDPAKNARAMATISAGGTNWNAWTVYTSGQYLRNMNASRDLMGGVSGAVGDTAGAWTGADNSASPITTVLSAVVSGSWWRRVLLGALGVALAAVGLGFTFGGLTGV